MKTFCFKFHDVQTAHACLYDDEGIPRYNNIYDNSKLGIRTQLVETESGDHMLVCPLDGSYYADIAGLVSVPPELQSYVITPNSNYRKHKFAGETE